MQSMINLHTAQLLYSTPFTSISRADMLASVAIMVEDLAIPAIDLPVEVQFTNFVCAMHSQSQTCCDNHASARHHMRRPI
jgi:hypothetical protein